MSSTTQARIQSAIDRCVSRGVPITVRGVRDEMVAATGKAASFSVISPYVREWNETHGKSQHRHRLKQGRKLDGLAALGKAVTRVVAEQVTSALDTVRTEDANTSAALRSEVVALARQIEVMDAALAAQTELIERLIQRADRILRPLSASRGRAKPEASRGTALSRQPIETDYINKIDGVPVAPLTPNCDQTCGSLPASIPVLTRAPDQRSTAEISASRAFCHSVVVEISTLLLRQAELTPDAPCLSPQEIAEQLPDDMLNAIKARIGHPAGAVYIRRLLRPRIERGRYVRLIGPDAYVADPDWRAKKQGDNASDVRA